MLAKKETAPEYFWYQKLRVLMEMYGEFSPQFVFWCAVIGGSDFQTLYFTEDFCQLGEPFAPEWTLDNFVAFGSVDLLDRHCRAEMFRRYCTGGGA